MVGGRARRSRVHRERALHHSHAGLCHEEQAPQVGWFADQMEPPPKMRMRTATEMKPDPTLDGPDVLKRFLRVQENIS